MAFDKTNTGTLSRNEKRTEPNHSEYNGSGQLTCPQCGATTEFWINAWVKAARETGHKFFSIRFAPKGARPAQAPPQQQTPAEEVPF